MSSLFLLSCSAVESVRNQGLLFLKDLCSSRSLFEVIKMVFDPVSSILSPLFIDLELYWTATVASSCCFHGITKGESSC